MVVGYLNLMRERAAMQAKRSEIDLEVGNGKLRFICYDIFQILAISMYFSICLRMWPTFILVVFQHRYPTLDISTNSATSFYAAFRFLSLSISAINYSVSMSLTIDTGKCTDIRSFFTRLIPYDPYSQMPKSAAISRAFTIPIETHYPCK